MVYDLINECLRGQSIPETAAAASTSAMMAEELSLMPHSQPPSAPTLVSAASPTTAASAARSFSWETMASSLLASLQAEAQSISRELDSQLISTHRTLEKLPSEIDGIKNYSSALLTYIMEVQVAVEDNEALSALKSLNRVKQRMEKCRSALKEAENWNTLSAEMDAIFGSGEYERAARRLAEAQRSLHLLVNDPDYEDRKKLLLKLMNNLEAVLVPQLLAALNEHDSDLVKRLYKSFDMVGRTNELSNFYYRARKMKLLKLWAEFGEDPAIKSIHRSFIDWLPRFYDEFLLVLSKEYHWCASIFPDSVEVINCLIRNVLTSLNPTMYERLASVKDRLGEAEFITHIIKGFMLSVHFAKRVERLLSESVLMSATTAEGGGFNGEVNSPKRDPLLRSDGWIVSVFDPFLPFQMDFGLYEKKFLVQQIANTLHINGAVDYMEQCNSLVDQISVLFKTAEGSLVRCQQFTRGYAAVELVENLNVFWRAVADKMCRVITQMSVELGLRTEAEVGGRSRAASANVMDSGANSNKFVSMESETEFKNMDFVGPSSTRGWTSVQVAIRILGLCAVLDRKLKASSTNLVNYLKSVKKLVETDELYLTHRPSATFTPLPQLSTSNPALDDLMDVGGGGGSGSSIVLVTIKSSPLNSSKLRSLLEFVVQQQSVGGESSSINLFKEAEPSLGSLILTAQEFVFDSLFTPIYNLLVSIPGMDSWKSSPVAVSSPFNLNVPQFSLSPSTYITRIGEHLLTLPQQLELYAEDEALSFSVKNLPFLNKEDLVDIVGVGGGGDDDKVVVNESPTAREDDDEEDAVTHLWLTSLSRGTMSGLTENILRIPVTLSEHGIKQIVTDLAYIINVFAAMDIEPLPNLTNLLGILEPTAVDLIKMLSERSKEQLHLFENEELLKKVLKLRNVAI